jgi:hypothetical protein
MIEVLSEQQALADQLMVVPRYAESNQLYILAMA